MKKKYNKTKEIILEQDIKKDCMMYVEKKRACNGLQRLECQNCRFYKPATESQKENYITKMKNLRTYIG